MPRTLDPNTVASNPGRLELSHDRLKEFHPELFSSFEWKCFLIGCRNLYAALSREEWVEHIAEHLKYGDSRAAVVVSAAPKLLVAAYTDELDCVALLEFDSKVARRHRLKEGDRLLTVNTYQAREAAPHDARDEESGDAREWETDVEPDLTPGPAGLGRYRNFAPYVADFLTDDGRGLRERKGDIDEAEWERAWALGRERLAAGQPVRGGEPLFCMYARRAAGTSAQAGGPPLKKYAGALAAAAAVVLMACAALLLGRAFEKRPFVPRAAASLDNSGKIYLVPVNDFPAERLEELARHYAGKYGTPVEVKPSLRTTNAAYDARRGQLVAEEVTVALRREYPFTGARGPVVIGVTADDIYIRKRNWNYAYSYRDDGAAVVSSARMGYAALAGLGEPTEEERAVRLRKMVAKNIGVMYYNLPLSDDPRSLLYSNVMGPRDLDRMGEDF